MKKIPELVLPGGDLHRTEIAFLYGADAVYVGLSAHSLRKAEVEFTLPKIKKAVGLAHIKKKKIYVTFNIFAHEDQIPAIKTDLKKIAAFKPDAFIISDPGIVNLAHNVAPKIPIHLSTQANTLNSESVKFWQKQGVKRIVLARETTLSDIKKIKKGVPSMELEVFVHGAMCIAYSGRCLMSAYLTGRSANLGSCTQPCRWNYSVKLPITNDQLPNINPNSNIKIPDSSLILEESSRPNDYFELNEDSHGSYLMGSKDLCLIEYIDELAKAGVDAFKIEGRNKTDYYVAVTARAYSKALELATINKQPATRKKELRLLKNELLSLTHRGYTSGFLFGDAKMGEIFPSRQPIQGKKYVGYVSVASEDNWATVIVKNRIETGKTYEVLTPDDIRPVKIIKIKDKSGVTSYVNPGEKDKKVLIKTNGNLLRGSIFRNTHYSSKYFSK